jgi:diguanylate cyclase (GGDEF)-like protein
MTGFRATAETADICLEEGTRARHAGADPTGEMRQLLHAEPSDAGTPVSVEAAFRRVRLLVGALLLGRLWTASSLPHLEAILLVAAFWSLNIVAHIAERQTGRTRVLLELLQLVGDTLVVLLVAWAQHEHASAESADWAVLVLPAIEGAVRFQLPGALASWLVLAGGYAGLNMATSPSLPAATIAQRLTVVLLVALPVGYLANQLVAEIDAHRKGRAQAEQRSVSLRAAALGGRRTSQLDVDEILEVICSTVCDMGFSEPVITSVADTSEHPAPSESTADGSLFVLSIPVLDDAPLVLTAHWPGSEPPPAATVESLELFAAQASASLHNARVHRSLEELKDRLDHQASHDPLTELANRRRFLDELARIGGSGRPGDLLGVLFIDLDGFKNVNDRYGHDTGNELLVAVAARLRACVRPGDLVARIGGDEFTIMLTRLETEAPAGEVAQRICNLLSDSFLVGRHEIQISTSVGVALARTPVADTEDLVRRADAAMYRAKERGKARWAMDPETEKTLEIAADIPTSGG